MGRRIAALLLIAVMTLTAAPALASITQEEALIEIYDILDRFYGYLPEDVELHQFGFGEENSVWVASFLLADHGDDSTGLYVIQIDAEGHLLQIDGPRAMNLAQQISHDWQLCVDRPDVEEDTHCYERLAAFYEKWQPLEAVLREGDWDVAQELAALALRPSLPAASALPYDAALEAALEHLAKQPGFDPENARMFRVIIDGYIQPEGFKRPLWSFSLSQHSYDGRYDDDRAMERYRAELDKAFDGQPPHSVTILLDAADGTLAEPPIIAWNADAFNYLDYFARMPDMLACYLSKED